MMRPSPVSPDCRGHPRQVVVRQRRLGLVHLREPEVEDLGAAARRDHDVRGLDVAMRDAALLRRRHRVGDLNPDAQQAIERHPAARQRLAQRLAVHEFHREEQPSAELLDRVDRDDTWMIQRGDGLRLALEALARHGIAGEDLRQDLEGDAPIQPRVFRDEHFAHPALAERFDDLVMPDDLSRLHVRDILSDECGKLRHHDQGGAACSLPSLLPFSPARSRPSRLPNRRPETPSRRKAPRRSRARWSPPTPASRCGGSRCRSLLPTSPNPDPSAAQRRDCSSSRNCRQAATRSRRREPGSSRFRSANVVSGSRDGRSRSRIGSRSPT